MSHVLIRSLYFCTSIACHIACVVVRMKSRLVCVVQGEFPSMEDMTVAKQALQDMRTLVGDLQKQLEQDAERKRKEDEEEEMRKKQAELEAQQEEQKKKTAALSAKEKTKHEGEKMLLQKI